MLTVQINSNNKIQIIEIGLFCETHLKTLEWTQTHKVSQYSSNVSLE